jgi:hypothetical protein
VQGRARIAAAEWLGQYLFGKPVETTVQLNMQSQNTSLPNMSDDDLERLARGLIAGQLPEDAGGEVVEESVQPPAGTEESWFRCRFLPLKRSSAVRQNYWLKSTYGCGAKTLVFSHTRECGRQRTLTKACMIWYVF